MTWVSNRSGKTAKVAITSNNTSGGYTTPYEIYTESQDALETWGNNHWRRDGVETASVTFENSTSKFETEVNSQDLLIIYSNAYIVIPNAKVSCVCL